MPAYRKRAIRRLAALLDLCRTHRYLLSLAELAQKHRCSVRTIRRDLEAMEDCGIRVPQWRKGQGRWA